MNRASGIKMQSKGSFVGNLRPSGANFGLDTPFGRVFSSFSPLFLLFSPSFSSSFSPSGGCRHTEKKPFFGTFSVLRPLFKKEEGQGEREGGQGGGTQV